MACWCIPCPCIRWLGSITWRRSAFKWKIWNGGCTAKRNSELVNDLIDSNLTEDIVFAHGAEKERVFREMMLERGIDQYRIPGLPEFLDRHRNVPMAIGSNAEPANINFILDHFGLRPYFKVAVNGHQVDRPKPFPDIYLKAAELLGSGAEAMHRF